MAEREERKTIYDIAREAGVSPKTVSRAVSGKPGVNEETRARILRVVERLGYYPHAGARSLRGPQCGAIGVALSAPMNVAPVSQELLVWLFNDLYRVFASKGERICFDLNPGVGSFPGDYARSVWDGSFVACVLVGPLALHDTTVLRIHQWALPYVAFGRLSAHPELCSATVDYEEGAYLSTKHLLERGHTRIALLKAFEGYQPGEERRLGYERALLEHGIPVDDHLVRSVSFGAHNVANVVHRLLADSTVTALVDSSATEEAAGFHEGARRAGRVPGKDLEVVVWTYSEDVTVLDEACAHVWLPVREAASEGLDLLAEWFRGKRDEAFQVLYHPTLSKTVSSRRAPKPRPLFQPVE